ncbi:MAG: hypothetical protein NC307_08470 [Roseburia sp.]|nr:hypothetical protein [Roseburia sp.]
MGIRHVASYAEDCWREEAVNIGNKTGDNIGLTGVKKQEILGFGGCFNELGWEALQLLPEEIRNFLPVSGMEKI